MENSNLDFGPTETQNHLLCRTLRRFEKEWLVKGPWKPYFALGAGMSVGLAHYLLNPDEEGLNHALGKAHETVAKKFEEGTEWTLEGLQGLVTKGVTKAAETTLSEMFKTEKVVGTEVSIGRGRLDLVTTPLMSMVESTPPSQGDYLIITDHKTSIQKAPRFLATDLKDVPLNWQLWDYAWRAQNYYGRPVKWIRQHIIILTPKTSCQFSDPAKVKPENLAMWEYNANLHWLDMAEDEGLAFNELHQNWKQCENKYGKCPAYDACHTLCRDEAAMENLYVRKFNKVS